MGNCYASHLPCQEERRTMLKIYLNVGKSFSLLCGSHICLIRMRTNPKKYCDSVIQVHTAWRTTQIAVRIETGNFTCT